MKFSKFNSATVSNSVEIQNLNSNQKKRLRTWVTHELVEGIAIAVKNDPFQLQSESSIKPFDQCLSLGTSLVLPIRNHRFRNLEYQIIPGIAYRNPNPIKHNLLIPNLFLANQALEIQPEIAFATEGTAIRRAFAKGFPEVIAPILPVLLGNLQDLPSDLLVVNPTAEILLHLLRLDLALLAVLQLLLQSQELFRLEGGESLDVVVSGRVSIGVWRRGRGGLVGEGGIEGFLELEIEGKVEVGLEDLGVHELAPLLRDERVNVVIVVVVV